MVALYRPLSRNWTSHSKTTQNLLHFQVIHRVYKNCALCPQTLKNFRKENSGSRKKAVCDWHLAVFVCGLVIVDLTILITYTTLEGLVAHFKAGTDVNREKPAGFEGVSPTSVYMWHVIIVGFSLIGSGD